MRPSQPRDAAIATSAAQRCAAHAALTRPLPAACYPPPPLCRTRSGELRLRASLRFALVCLLRPEDDPSAPFPPGQQPLDQMAEQQFAMVMELLE
jgi:hypothetical protein